MSIFNKIKKNSKQEVLWEGDMFFCLLDGSPVSPGASLIIPNREIKGLLDLNQQEWMELKLSIERTVKNLHDTDLIKKYSEMYEIGISEKSKEYIKDVIEFLKENGFKPDAYNYGVNDGKEAGRTVPHLHIHVIPRFKGDVKDSTGGIRHIFPNKANYRK